MQKVGILGGGQLGRMLLQAAINYPVETYVLEDDDKCPAAHLCHYFVNGSIRDFDTVYRFGKNLDAVTIEIENVNIDALEQLEKEGVKIFPKPSVLRIIHNKVLQKEYYSGNRIPTAEFTVLQSKSEIKKWPHLLPAVQKKATGGYDGRGVQVIEDLASSDLGFDEHSVLERKIRVKKEISVIVAVSQAGKTTLYPPVEMMFNKDLNLLDYQICPAAITKEVLWKSEAIALSLVRNFKSPGLFAVEMFVDENNEVFVNETAPRVHNSGHHTIEAHYCSQFDMLWRIILNYPLGDTSLVLPSIMINVIGSQDQSGDVRYLGIEEVLGIDNAFLHLYGKAQTKPGRKMGHVTVLSSERQDLIHKANRIKHTIKVVAEKPPA